MVRLNFIVVCCVVLLISMLMGLLFGWVGWLLVNGLSCVVLFIFCRVW